MKIPPPFLALLLLLGSSLACSPPAGVPCVPRTCQALGFNCGAAADGCGGTLSCGACAAPQTCGGAGAPNVCGAPSTCTPESDASLCARLQATCGPLTALDNCSASRAVASCGTCALPQTCGGGGTPGRCGNPGCAPEPDAALCQRAGRNCGPFSGRDNCGSSRTVASCGACPAGQSCNAAGVCQAPTCVPESAEALCARYGKTCGDFSATDNCGAPRWVASCGACASPQTCSANVCSCSAEGNGAFCSRLGKSCGAVSGTDNCGKPRSVASCGTCASPQTCGGGGVANVCGCVAETDAAFCTRLGKNCGAVSGTDTCGKPRSVPSCGTCASPQTCGGGGPSVCGCVAESELAFCSRLGKTCGPLSGTDTCGTPRSVVSCGTCALPQTCGGGSTSGVCGCTAESDAAFCSRLAKNCGPLTANDNCGKSRSVASCGTCASPNTCGGAGTSGVCACPVETDVAFCARLGKGCGAVTGTDSCGMARSVASCGTCAGGLVCGAGGTANICGVGAPPVPGAVCARSGWCFDWPLPTDNTLTDVHALSATSIWAVGDQGSLLHFDGTSWTGSTQAGLRATAVWALNDSDVWVVAQDSGGKPVVLHGGMSGFGQVRVPTQNAYGAVFGFGASDVWLGGYAGEVARWNGSAFVGVGKAGSGKVKAIWGLTSSQLFVASGGAIYRYDGSTFTQEHTGSGEVNAIHGVDANTVWAVRDNTVLRRVGATWAATYLGSSSDTLLMDVRVRSATEAWAVGYEKSAFRPRTYAFNGTAWYEVSTNLRGLPLGLSSAPGVDLVLVGTRGLTMRLGGGTWTSLGSVLPTYPPRFASVHGASGTNDVWAVGTYDACFGCATGAAYRRTTGVWSEGNAPGLTVPNAPNAVYVRAPTEVWLTHSGGAWRYNGSSTAAVGSANWISSLAGTASETWLGRRGGVSGWTGSTWQPEVTPIGGTQLDVEDLFTLGGANAWGVGSFGIMKSNGDGTWSLMPSWTGGAVSSVWASSLSSVWVASSSKLARYDGTSWTSFSLPTGSPFARAVWGESATQVRFVGDAGLLGRVDSAGVLTVEASPTQRGLVDLWCDGPKCYAVGEGVILRR